MRASYPDVPSRFCCRVQNPVSPL